MPEIGAFPIEINISKFNKQPLEVTHNPKVVGSNPAPATTYIFHQRTSEFFGGAFFLPQKAIGNTMGTPRNWASAILCDTVAAVACQQLVPRHVDVLSAVLHKEEINTYAYQFSSLWMILMMFPLMSISARQV